jgi:exopolysaccharide production protein ExoY
MSTQSPAAAWPERRIERERGIWNVVQPLERAASLLILLLLSPLFVLVSITIVALSRRSPLVAHLRIGQFGRPLWTLKFRTMWSSEPRGKPLEFVEYIVDESGPNHKSSADQRITSEFAHFCRRFSIDELPQFLHVVRGEMSIVAPRPLTAGELQNHYGTDAAEVLCVKPGITGLWQVSGRSRLSYGERRQFDLFLVRNRSLRLYFKILLRTIPVMLIGKDGW